MSNILPILNKLCFKSIGELNDQTNLLKSLSEYEKDYDGIQYTFHKDNCPMNSHGKIMRQCDIIQIPQGVRVFSKACNTYINAIYIPLIHLLFDELYLTFDEPTAIINAYMLNKTLRLTFHKQNQTLYDNKVVFRGGICDITNEIDIENIEKQNVEYYNNQPSSNATVNLPYGQGIIKVKI